MEPKERILETLRRELPGLKERFNVKSLDVFGSYIRREQGGGSDLDILVEYEKTPGLFKFIELEDLLSDLLGAKVDLVMKDSLKPAIGRHILKEATPV